MIIFFLLNYEERKSFFFIDEEHTSISISIYIYIPTYQQATSNNFYRVILQFLLNLNQKQFSSQFVQSLHE